MSDAYVLDASAILCLLRGEPGANIVQAVLPGISVSTVNLAEVIAKMVDLGMDAKLIAEVLDPLQLRAVVFDAPQARASGMLREKTRALGLSLGDRACLALAAHLGATALTADKAWSGLDAVATIRLVR